MSFLYNTSSLPQNSEGDNNNSMFNIISVCNAIKKVAMENTTESGDVYNMSNFLNVYNDYSANMSIDESNNIIGDNNTISTDDYIFDYNNLESE